MIIGNKIDIGKKRQVKYEEGIELAKKYNAPFMEVSAKTGINVSEAFDMITKKMHEKNKEIAKRKDNIKKKTEVLTVNIKKNAVCC